MRTGQTHLFIPGPTRVPESVRRAMSAPQMGMGAAAVDELMQGLAADLGRVLGTAEGEILLFPGSGPSACETAITNTLNPGDKVLMARHGHYSSLWIQTARMLGLEPVIVDLPWGAAAPVAEFDRILGRDVHGEIKAVFVTHTETATGVVSDVAAVRRALDSSFHDALLFVDGVAAIGAMRFEMDAWGVDLAVAGSQVGMMMPGGLCILGASRKALAASRIATMPRAYHDFDDLRGMTTGGGGRAVLPMPMLRGLRAALDRIMGEGPEAVFARHARLAEGIRRGVAAWGLDLVAEPGAALSDAVTAVRLPCGVDARDVLRIARDELNAAFGAGLGHQARDVIRIGHLGDFDEGMALAALSLAELALMRAGARVVPGSGTAAAQAWFMGAGGGARSSAARPCAPPSWAIAAE